MQTLFRPATCLLLLVGACATPTRSIDRLWADLEADARHSAPLADPDGSERRETAERAASVRKLVADGELETGRDHLRAAVILVESEQPADWELAAEMGNRAAQLGEGLGLRVVAEAIDKDLISQGLPQRFGTQYAWDPVLSSWHLYPIDPTTSDAERATMGVPSYAELAAAEVALNQRAP